MIGITKDYFNKNSTAVNKNKIVDILINIQ